MAMDNQKTMIHAAENSLQLYEELKGVLLQIDEGLKTDINGKIAALVKKYVELEKQCRLVDESISQLFTSLLRPADEVMLLLEKRGAIHTEILALIEEVIPKAARVKTLLTSEFEAIKKGRTALRGYKSNMRNHGRIINRSS